MELTENHHIYDRNIYSLIRLISRIEQLLLPLRSTKSIISVHIHIYFYLASIIK